MMSDIWVSPKYTIDDLTSGRVDQITVFEDKVIGWTLDHADVLVSSTNPNARHAGFAILMLCTAYFESIEAFMTGTSSAGKASAFFRKGFLRVFPNIGAGRTLPLSVTDRDVLVTAICDEIRNGLYHQMNVKSRVAITQNGVAVDFLLDANRVPTAIVLDPWEILKTIKQDFTDVIAQLRDASQTALRTSFTNYFDATRVGAGVTMTTFAGGAKSTR
jgi:hypothetical protein